MMKQPNYLKYLNFKDTVANEPNAPAWAMEKARELAASRDTYSSMMLPWITTIARALVEARAEGAKDAGLAGLFTQETINRVRAEALAEAENVAMYEYHHSSGEGSITAKDIADAIQTLKEKL